MALGHIDAGCHQGLLLCTKFMNGKALPADLGNSCWHSWHQGHVQGSSRHLDTSRVRPSRKQRQPTCWHCCRDRRRASAACRATREAW